MSVLIITNDFPPLGGGMSERACSLASEWAKAGEKIVVVTPIKGPSTEHYERVVVSINGHYLKKAFQLSHIIKKVIRERNIKKIFCLSWSPPGMSVLFSQMYKTLKWGVTVNGFDITDGLRALHTRLLLRILFNRVDLIIAPSEFLKKEIHAVGDFSKKSFVVSNGIDLKKYHPSLSGEVIREKYDIKDKIVIMTLCRLVPIKGVDILMDSFYRISEKFSNAVLLIAGSGPQENELHEKAASMNTENRILFTGEIHHQETPFYYAACDMFVQANRVYGDLEEGQGITLMEAAACGKPVISTMTGGIPEVIKDNETGFLVPPDSPDELSEKLEYLIARPDERTRLGKNAATDAAKRFDDKINTQLIMKYLNTGNFE
jgi:glycosyltransferase involved in cell wall biosynthesis